MLVATWNLEWAGPGSARTPYLRKHLRAVGADAAVLTEVHLGTLDDWAHVADPGPHPKVRVPGYFSVRPPA